ncbi:MAG: NUDIX domain-containing protein [Myxococcota bacterium]
MLVDDEDPVHDGTRRKIERLGVVAGPDVWLRHYVQCAAFRRGTDREPLTAIVPLVARAMDLQTGAPPPGRGPIPTHWIVLAVVRRGGRYLVVHELHHHGWFLPAGRVEPAEPIATAARREVLEESGVHVEVTGLLRVEHRPTEFGCRVRVFVAAEALGEAAPRTTANDHTREARWVTLDELRALPLRAPEVLEVLTAVESGLPVVPWSVWDATGTFG